MDSSAFTTSGGAAAVMDYPACSPSAPRWRDHLGIGGYFKLALLVGLVLAIYWGHFVRMFQYWGTFADWSHGYLIAPFSLYLVHLKRRELLTGEHRGSLWGLPVMIFSAWVYFFSIRKLIGYPQGLSFIPMAAGLILLLRGWRSLRLTAFPLAFLVLAVPPPPYRYEAMTQPLQQSVAWAATAALKQFPGVLDVERGGVNITFVMYGGLEGAVHVAGACSGMRSLMAFIALGLAMAYFAPRPAWHRITIAALVVPVALFCNFLRVVAVGAAQMYGYEDLSDGTPHALIGFLMFGVGFMIYLGALWILDHLYVEEHGTGLEGPLPEGTS